MTGTSVQLYGTLISNATSGNIAQIKLDDSDPQPFQSPNLGNGSYDMGVVSNYQYYNSGILDPGIHTVILNATQDNAVFFDYLLVPTVNSSPTGDSSDSSSGSKNHAGAIAGGVVGGVVGLALIAALIFFFMRRRRNGKPTEIASIYAENRANSRYFSEPSVHSKPTIITYIRLQIFLAATSEVTPFSVYTITTPPHSVAPNDSTPHIPPTTLAPPPATDRRQKGSARVLAYNPEQSNSDSTHIASNSSATPDTSRSDWEIPETADVRIHQDSGVRGLERQVVDVPPTYSAD